MAGRKGRPARVPANYAQFDERRFYGEDETGRKFTETTRYYRELGYADPQMGDVRKIVDIIYRDEKGHFTGERETRIYDWSSATYMTHGFGQILDSMLQNTPDAGTDGVIVERIHELKEMYNEMTDDERNTFWKLLHDEWPAKEFPSDGYGHMLIGFDEDDHLTSMEDWIRTASPSVWEAHTEGRTVTVIRKK